MEKLRLRLMYYVTKYNLHPSCIMNMDETAAKLLGGAAWLGATGALHRRR